MAKKIDGILTNLTSDKKCELFDFFLNEYLKGGFGSMSKSDIDALVYAVLQKSGMDKLSDYDISIELGITKQRVRALQEKYSVKMQQQNDGPGTGEYIHEVPSVIQ